MTTTTLHADVQRSRFTHHALAALAGWLPAVLRRAFEQPVAPTASVDARRVRALAAAHAKSDPGFASDLYAAAARHEGGHAK